MTPHNCLQHRQEPRELLRPERGQRARRRAVGGRLHLRQLLAPGLRGEIQRFAPVLSRPHRFQQSPRCQLLQHDRTGGRIEAEHAGELHLAEPGMQTKDHQRGELPQRDGERRHAGGELREADLQRAPAQEAGLCREGGIPLLPARSPIISSGDDPAYQGDKRFAPRLVHAGQQLGLQLREGGLHRRQARFATARQHRQAATPVARVLLPRDEASHLQIVQDDRGGRGIDAAQPRQPHLIAPLPRRDRQQDLGLCQRLASFGQAAVKGVGDLVDPVEQEARLGEENAHDLVDRHARQTRQRRRLARGDARLPVRLRHSVPSNARPVPPGGLIVDRLHGLA